MKGHCAGRKAYGRAMAQSVVYRIRAQGSAVEAYSCALCGKWHVRAGVSVMRSTGHAGN